ncbi:hypothetical protein FCV25MIE_01298 [Fagus crenata]
MESLLNREWDDDLGKNQVVVVLHHAPPQTSKDYPILSQHDDSTSSSSDSSSGGFSSSDTDSMYGVRSRSSSCFAPPRPKSVQTSTFPPSHACPAPSVPIRLRSSKP